MNLSKKTTFFLMGMGVAIILASGCGATSSLTSSSSNSTSSNTPAVSQAIGNFTVSSDKTTLPSSQFATFTLTPPNANLYSYRLITTSTAAVTYQSSITAGSGSISISSTTTNTTTFTLKGSSPGQIISVAVGITSEGIAQGTANITLTIQ